MSRRRRSQRQPIDVAAALDRIVAMLDESWKDLVLLRTYRAEFERLAEHLQHYEGSKYIEQWYVADMLMGCRRVVEFQADEVLSVRKALYQLRGIADQLTAADITACRNRHRAGATASTVAGVERELQALIGSHTTGDPIGVRVVQQDLDRITEVAERVHRLATHAVAHRLSVELDESARSVTRADVAQLVEDLNDICGRWTHLLRNVTLSEPADSPLSAAILKALELFDFDAFAEAVAEEIRRLGPSAGSYRDVEARARIEYRFD